MRQLLGSCLIRVFFIYLCVTQEERFSFVRIATLKLLPIPRTPQPPSHSDVDGPKHLEAGQVVL